MSLKVGQIAREIRITKGIKQSFISDRLGFKHPSSYADIEKGRRNLTAEKVPLLAKALGVPIEELFFEENVRKTRNNSNTA